MAVSWRAIDDCGSPLGGEAGLVAPPDVLDALKLKPGAPARVWVRSK
jgi:hypothetical protein